jgi:hypothetical protein
MLVIWTADRIQVRAGEVQVLPVDRGGELRELVQARFRGRRLVLGKTRAALYSA